MKTLGLNHVAVYVTDLKRSVEFYEKVLKLTPVPHFPFNFPGVWFQLGTNQELHLSAELGDPFFKSYPNNHFALKVDNLDEWEKHLELSQAKTEMVRLGQEYRQNLK